MSESVSSATWAPLAGADGFDSRRQPTVLRLLLDDELLSYGDVDCGVNGPTAWPDLELSSTCPSLSKPVHATTSEVERLQKNH